jgi:hypothetical protein
LDIVGNDVVEGLNEPDSIEALEQLDEDNTAGKIDIPQLKRKRRQPVSIVINYLHFSILGIGFSIGSSKNPSFQCPSSPL